MTTFLQFFSRSYRRALGIETPATLMVIEHNSDHGMFDDEIAKAMSITAKLLRDMARDNGIVLRSRPDRVHDTLDCLDDAEPRGL